MDNTFDNSSFSKAILSGLLTGIMAAILNLFYVIIYRDIDSFATAKIIQPISIFIGFPVFGMVAGYIYFLLAGHLRRLNWYIIGCIALLGGLVLLTVMDTRNNGGSLVSGLRGMCLGLEVITCLLALFLIPYFVRHPDIYE